MTGHQSSAAGNQSLDAALRAASERARAQGLERRCPSIEARDGLRYTLDGRRVVSFCSNDYLGLADLGELGALTGPAPSGAAASRLVCGDLASHRQVEEQFAQFVGSEDAVLFPSGFQANVTVPSALIGAHDRISSDALNHASIIDGLRLAKVRPEISAHGQRPAKAVLAEGARQWWICESVFSMDGDGPALADLEGHLAEGGCLYLDEAHALGLYAGGRGRAGELLRKPTVLVAPLGKALGCAGAFVAGSRPVCAWLRGHARGFVFTTGVSPVLLPRIEVALDLLAGPEGESRRAALWRNVETFRRSLGIESRGSFRSPIHPIVVGGNARALDLSAALLERGWHVQAIRPPTVPEGAARLRITISAMHERESIEALAGALTSLMNPGELRP